MATRTYLSIDVANRSLAFTYVEFASPPAGAREDLSRLIERVENAGPDIPPRELRALAAEIDRLDATIQPCRVLAAGSADLTGGKKVKEVPLIARLTALHEFLHSAVPLPADLPAGAEVLIEFQMGPNSKSHEIEAALIYHFAPVPGSTWTVRTIGPVLKNKIAPAPEGEWYRFRERSEAKSNYRVNKAHARFNFEYLMDAWGLRAAYAKCCPQHRNDLADTLMQALAVWKGDCF